MAICGGGSTTQVVQNSQPPAFQKPFIEDVFKRAKQLYYANGPAAFPGLSVAPFAPAELAAQKNLLKTAQGPVSDIARSSANALSFLSGPVMDPRTNPALAAAAEGAVRPVFTELRESTLPAIRSGAVASGNIGSSRQGIAEAQAIERASRAGLDATSALYNEGYKSNLDALVKGLALSPQVAGLQTMPASLISGVGEAQRGFTQQLLNDQIAKFNYSQSLPYQKLAEYAGKVMGNFGGTGTSTSIGGGTSPLIGALGGAASGLGITSALGQSFPALAGLGPWGAGIGALIGLLGS